MFKHKKGCKFVQTLIGNDDDKGWRGRIGYCSCARKIQVECKFCGEVVDDVITEEGEITTRHKCKRRRSPI